MKPAVLGLLLTIALLHPAPATTSIPPQGTTAQGICEPELIQCRADATFQQNVCAERVSCNLNQAATNPRYEPPTWDESPVWLRQDYTFGCDCPKEKYSFQCEQNRPGMCQPGEVWDGTFSNQNWTSNPYTVGNAKEATCFLGSNIEGIAGAIASGIRHHRVNLTVGQLNDATSEAGVDITWAITSRFRPSNNVQGSSDPQKPPWAYFCLPCGGDPSADLPCNTLPASKKNLGKITCLSSRSKDISPEWAKCEVPDMPWIYPASRSGGVEDTSVGGECCEEAVKWFECKLSGCHPSCTADGNVRYDCASTKCTAHQPSYLNPASAASQWALINKIPEWANGSTWIEFAGRNPMNGTSNMTTVSLPDSQDPSSRFVFTHNCMYGACVSADAVSGAANISLSKTNASDPEWRIPRLDQDPVCFDRKPAPQCNPNLGCTVCDACCTAWIKDPSDCTACAKSECAPVCDPTAGCTVCDACCKAWTKNATDCAACALSECAGPV